MALLNIKNIIISYKSLYFHVYSLIITLFSVNFQAHYILTHMTKRATDESIHRDEVVDQLLQRYLPDDTDTPSFFNHPNRREVVLGLRAFHLALRISQQAITDDLAQAPYKSLLAINHQEPDTISATNVSYLLNPDIVPNRVRAIKSPKFRTIALAHYLIAKSGGDLSIEEQNGQLVFLNKNQPIDTRSPRLKKKVGLGRKRKHVMLESAGADRSAGSPAQPCFLAFYWRPHRKKTREKVGYALVKPPTGATTPEHSWVGAEVTYWYSDGQHKTVVTESNPSDGHMLSLRLIDAPGQKRTGVWTQITLDWTSDKAPIYVGAFASLSGKFGLAHPAAGLMVWWRQPSLEACEDLIRQYVQNPESIPDEVFHFLLGQRVDVPADGAVESFDALPRAKNAWLLAEVADSYQGFFVHPITGHVTLFICKISRAGRVECRYPTQHKHPRLQGFAIPHNHGIRVDLDFDHDNGTYRLHYFLEGGLTDNRYLLGVYAGFDHSFTHPTSGRVVLQKQADPVVADLDMFTFCQSPQYLKVGQYLSGQQGLVAATDSQAVEELRNVTRARPLAQLAGTYDLYMTERRNPNDPPEIFRYRLEVQRSGKALLSGNGRSGEGMAEVSRDHLLRIQFGLPTNQLLQGSLLVSLCDDKGHVERYDQIRHLFGMATLVNQDRIMAMVAVLKPSPSADEGLVPIDPLPIRFHRQMSVEQQNQTRVGFDSYDKQLAGLLSALEGEAYRLIRLPKSPNHPFRPRRTQDRRTAFFAACHLARHYSAGHAQEKMVDLRDDIKGYLLEAFRHGFATLRFGGALVRELGAQGPKPERLMQFLRQHGIDTVYLNRLKGDFRDLIRDYALLISAYDDPAELGHPDLNDLVERLWGDMDEYRALVSA